MKILLLLVCCICLLSGCAIKTGCTNIMLYDYDDPKGFAVHWWEAEYREYPFDGFAGMAISKRYLGQGTYEMVDHCKEPLRLDGYWYAVFIDTGTGGDYILTGRGWGRSVDVRPNSIRSSEINRIAEHSRQQTIKGESTWHKLQ